MPINTGGKGQAALMMTRPGCRRISWLWKMGQVGPGVVRGGCCFPRRVRLVMGRQNRIRQLLVWKKSDRISCDTAGHGSWIVPRILLPQKAVNHLIMKQHRKKVPFAEWISRRRLTVISLRKRIELQGGEVGYIGSTLKD